MDLPGGPSGGVSRKPDDLIAPDQVDHPSRHSGPGQLSEPKLRTFRIFEETREGGGVGGTPY